MSSRVLFIVALFASICSNAQAQQAYAGLEKRTIKALSDQQIYDLRAGRGMGMALPAELNGYPGPSHVIELADKLTLSESQVATAKILFASMKAEAIPLGERLISQKSELERHFAGRTITPALLTGATVEIGATQAALAETHLKYHLSTAELLTPSQRQRYSELRGYEGGAPQHHHH